MNIGYIGIGIMGEPMARNLLKAGYQIHVFNRTCSKCDTLASEGAVVCNTPADVASKSDIIFLNVPDTPDVETVLFGDNGIENSAREKLIVIDNSTISPSATRRFAEKLKIKGVRYLDAPVSGGDIGAQKGTLSIMVGGEKEIFDKCLPLFEVLGSKVTLVGEVGMGQTCKACNQLFCAIHMLACCEGIALAKKSGLDMKTMVNVVSSGAGGSWALENLGPKIIDSDMEPGFMIKLLNKDLQFTKELAHNGELPLAGLEMVTELFQQAQQDGHGRDGTQALCKILEKIANFTFKDE